MSMIVKRNGLEAFHYPDWDDLIAINLHGQPEERIEEYIIHYFLGEWLCIYFKEHGFTRECMDTKGGWKAHYVIGCRPFHVVSIIEDELKILEELT